MSDDSRTCADGPADAATVGDGSAPETRGGDRLRRFVVFAKSDARTEAGELPDEASLAEMVAFNDRLVDAGVMLQVDGLQVSSAGARLRFSGESVAVQPGPFLEPEKLVAGFWVIQARSLEAAIEWMKDAPMGGPAELEIRPVLGADDLGEAFTAELQAREDDQRRRIEAQARPGDA
jgi:hypothetical protein